MRLRWIAVLMLPLAVVACSDEEPTQEPVAGETAPAVPDAPGGDMGEAGANPADAAGMAQDAASPGGDMAATPGSETAGEVPGAEAGKPATAGDSGVGGGSMVVTAGGLNVRSGPGTKHKSLRVLKKGTKISVESCSGNWCRIGDGEFVSKKFLSSAM